MGAVASSPLIDVHDDGTAVTRTSPSTLPANTIHDRELHITDAKPSIGGMPWGIVNDPDVPTR